MAEYSISRSITAAPPGRMSTAAVLGEDAAQALAGRVADAAYFDGLRERIRQHADKPATLPAGAASHPSRPGAKAGSR